MEAKAVARYIRISPRKARLVADLVRGKEVGEALTILRFTPRKAARLIEKVLNSAIANAEHNLELATDSLIVRRAFVDEGPTMKRWRPRAFGRANRINKRMSHITIVVGEKEEGKNGSKN